MAWNADNGSAGEHFGMEGESERRVNALASLVKQWSFSAITDDTLSANPPGSLNDGVILDPTSMPGTIDNLVTQDQSQVVEPARQFIDFGNPTSISEVTEVQALKDQTAVPQNDLETSFDEEMAMMLQALENGAGEMFGIPIEDQDSSPDIFECCCGDSFTYKFISEGHAVLLNCGCARCLTCLNDNIRHGLQTRKNFPPKCCEIIEIRAFVQYLDEDILTKWAEVRDEYEDVAPCYCASPGCSEYIPKENLAEKGQWAVCNLCNLKTCTGCRCLQSAHISGSESCPERIQKLDRELIRKEGWKDCPLCGATIEKIDGCDHMICECGEEFCYICGGVNSDGMPCNCDGQRPWVEEDVDAIDLRVQQQLLDEARENALQTEPDESGHDSMEVPS